MRPFVPFKQTGKHSKRAVDASGRVLLVTGMIALSACASAPLRAPAREAVQVTALESTSALPSPALIRALAAARAALDAGPALPAMRWRWQQRLASLEAQAGETATLAAAQRLAREIQTQAQDYYRWHGGQYLSQLRQFSRLTAAQYDRQRAAEFAWHRNDHAQAYAESRALVRELFVATQWLAVESGDSLISLAAQPKGYDNGLLWPLLWRANKGLLPAPTALRDGMRLRVPSHPQLQEIFEAAEFARARSALRGEQRRSADADYLRRRYRLRLPANDRG